VRLADDVDPVATLGALLQAGVLATLAGGNVLRFAPSLTVGTDEIDEGLTAVATVLADPPRR